MGEDAAEIAARRGVPYLSMRYRGALPSVGAVSAVALLRDKGDVCFVNHAERDWELPGGKVSSSETALAGAKRECAEETGMRPTTLEPLCVVRFYNNHDEALTKHVWTTTSWTGVGSRDTEEINRVAWWRQYPPTLSFGQYEKIVLRCIPFPSTNP